MTPVDHPVQPPRLRAASPWLALGLVGWMLGCQVDAGGLDAPPEARRPLDTKLDADAALATMERVNDAFMAKWPSPGDAIVVKREVLPGNSWSRAVYFEGLMALAAVDPKPAYDDYAEAWAESHAWQLGAASTTPTRFADDQCAAQTYLELHARRPENGARIAAVEASVDAMVTSTKVDDWTWIDAIQMAMPVFARLGTLRGDARIFDKMNALYTYARDTAGGHGLYDPDAHLWWRDATFTPPYAEPNGASCYWARGNGWVYAGLARVLDVLARDEPHRAAYEADFVAMSESLRTLRRDDGFWNVSLHDPTHFGGKELSGTSLFVYGMAWGIRHGLLSETVYRPLVVGSWNAMVTEAVHPDGPSRGQRVGRARQALSEESLGGPRSAPSPHGDPPRALPGRERRGMRGVGRQPGIAEETLAAQCHYSSGDFVPLARCAHEPPRLAFGEPCFARRAEHDGRRRRNQGVPSRSDGGRSPEG